MNDRYSNCLLRCENIRKVYLSGHESLEVLNNLRLEVYEKEFLAITGESGSGKSTLLHLLGCLDLPTEGEISYLDKSFTNLYSREQDRMRNLEFGFVFQFHHLLPEFNALENVALPGMMAGTATTEVWNRARQLLTDLGIADRAGHKPSQLSGGEQQRVAVARAMINRPNILFMDEPTGNLDPKTSDDLMNVIRVQQREKDLTIVMVTHNLDFAKKADRHLVLENKSLRPIEEAVA